MSQGSIYDDVTYYGSSDLLLPDMSAYMNMTFAAHMGLLNDELMIDKHNKSCIGQKIYINPTAHVDESVEMGGHVVIHGGAFIGPHVSLENVIVMSGVLIEPHSHFKNCLLSQEWIYHHEKGRIERHMIRPAYKIEAPITNAA